MLTVFSFDSFNSTIRFSTSLPSGLQSLSIMKYPCLSNWNLLSTGCFFMKSHTFEFFFTTNDSGFR